MTTGELTACPYPFPEVPALELAPEYGEFRRTPGLPRLEMPYGGQAWLATRHADVKFVLADPRFSRAAALNKDIPRTMPMVESTPNILAMDPPNHSRVRRVVAKAFTARNIELLRPRVEALVDGLVAGMTDGKNTADLVDELALPMAITAISEMLGVPEDERDEFHDWSTTAAAIKGPSIEEIVAANESLWAFFRRLVAERTQRPSDDLISTILAAHDAEGRLTEEEMVSLGVTILSAGHETTANQLSGHVFTLMAQRELWQRLVDRPQDVSDAVEELLRFTPLGVVTFARIAKEDIEVGGTLVRAGESVVMQVAAANLDEEVFADADKIDFDRESNPHIAFGHGAHHCLGAPLARLELKTAMTALVRKLPTLRLAVPADEVVFKQGGLLRGPESLPVTW
ncbi:cytochrome P450 [Kutzneria sp. CA-103260]|uniref:cytochrome P450 n=1 Tax=Kutzneria sp. CA-103260 TaxID=2802641 RepID=UPI001BF10CEC|nr:cytochrome P450 [Kutzneria sp. CA-103260]QUQ65108.1 cytochrome P450 [Kutzneria sp. CA-103260]